LREIEKSKPDAVVLIDYPGFIASRAGIAESMRRAKSHLLQHQPPSLGLEPRRIKKMAPWSI